MTMHAPRLSPSDGTDASSLTYTHRQVRIILIFAFLGTLFDGAELNLIGYPLAYISDSLGVTTLAIVTVATVQGFASVAGGFIFGWLGDSWGRRRTFGASVLIFGAAAILGGLAPNYGVFMLTRVLAGVGMGGLFGTTFSMFTECWKSKKRGAMGGLIQSMYFLGEILTALTLLGFITLLGHNAGWRTGYIAIGAVSFATGLMVLRYLPESKAWLEYQRRLADGTLPPQMRRTKVPFMDIFRGPYLRGTLVFMVLATAMFLTTNSVGAYLSTYLLKTQHLSLNHTTIIVLIGYVVTASAYSLTGYASDRIGRRTAFAASCLIGIVGFTWFLIQVKSGTAHVTNSFWADSTFWALMLCAGASGGFGVLGVWMSEFYPTRIRSTGSSGSYYVGRGLGAGVYPLFSLGLAGTVPLALALGVVGPVAGLIASLFAPDNTGRDIQAIE